jgi:RNA polymerase sigma-70 factor (ECF subfamily)
MLLIDARRDARVGPSGEVVLLEDQDRRQWDRSRLAEGLGLLGAHPIGDEVGPYRVEAEIARLHAAAPSVGATDWARVAAWYALLREATGSAVVALNEAVAVAMARGPASGLDLIDDLAATGELDGYAPLHSARADLLRRLDRRDEAIVAYRRARALAAAEPEQRFLDARLRELEA